MAIITVYLVGDPPQFDSSSFIGQLGFPISLIITVILLITFLLGAGEEEENANRIKNSIRKEKRQKSLNKQRKNKKTNKRKTNTERVEYYVERVKNSYNPYDSTGCIKRIQNFK